MRNLDNSIGFESIYPVNSSISSSEQLGPGYVLIPMIIIGSLLQAIMYYTFASVHYPAKGLYFR